MSYVYQLPYLDARSGQTTSGQQTNPITAIFSADGTKMILAGATNLPPNGTGDVRSVDDANKTNVCTILPGRKQL